MSEASIPNGGSRVALITGANRGLGFEIARQLAARGVKVVLTSRKRSDALQAAAALHNEGLSVLTQVLDVTDSASIAAARDYVANDIGRLDILINNAGISQMLSRCKASETPLEVVRQTFEVNVFGLIAVTNALLPLIARSAAGRIVNVSSATGSMTLVSQRKLGFGPNDLIMAYSASKSAVTSVTLQYATELRDTTIKVNAVCPGYTATDMTGRQGQPVTEGAKIIVDRALLPDDGPTGTYVNAAGTLPW